jgi:hypothetical protein
MSDEKTSRRCIFWGIGIFGVILIGAMIIIPGFAVTRCGGPSSSKNACINNLRQIDGAKEQWSLENHLEGSAESVVSEVDTYIKGGHPKCPDGGTYTYGKVSEPPRCSVKDHVLPP